MAAEEPRLPPPRMMLDLVMLKLAKFVGAAKPTEFESELDVVRAAIFEAIRALPRSVDSPEEIGPHVEAQIDRLWAQNPALRSEFDLDFLHYEGRTALELAIRDTRLGVFMSERHVSNPELRRLLPEAPEEEVPGPAAVRSFLRSHQRTGFLRELSGREKRRLIRALGQMPVVRRILSGDISNLREAARSPQAGRWLAPATSGDPLDRETWHNVRTGMAQIVNMVDPELLERVPVPRVVVNPNPSKLEAIRNWRLQDLAGFRAYSSRHSQEIHIAPREAAKIVVHETGHQLEYFLPTTTWLDIQQLLRMRHEQGMAADRRNVLVPIRPRSLAASVRQEARYRAEMPATGPYSARFYGSGNTEVMSMSLEYFSNPETARELILNDPLQAAIILRSIQPREFRSHIPAALQLLLPQYSASGEYREEGSFDESPAILRGQGLAGVRIIDDYFPGPGGRPPGPAAASAASGGARVGRPAPPPPAPPSASGAPPRPTTTPTTTTSLPPAAAAPPPPAPPSGRAVSGGAGLGGAGLGGAGLGGAGLGGAGLGLGGEGGPRPGAVPREVDERTVPVLRIGDRVVFTAPNGMTRLMQVSAIDQYTIENRRHIRHFYAIDPTDRDYVVGPRYSEYGTAWRLP